MCTSSPVNILRSMPFQPFCVSLYHSCFFSFSKHLLVHFWLFYFPSLSFPSFIILCTALISIVFNSFSSLCIYRPPLHLPASLCTLSFLAGQIPAFQCFFDNICVNATSYQLRACQCCIYSLFPLLPRVPFNVLIKGVCA